MKRGVSASIDKDVKQSYMKTTLIIQARMGSSRLPGKVMRDLAGRPMLDWVVRRGSAAELIDDVLIATTDDLADAAIVDWARENGIPVYAGSVFDVLDRFYHAAQLVGADRIVRVTGDCPLIDAGVIDELIRFYDAEGADFAANRLPPPWHRTYPIGLDVEMTTMAWLTRAFYEAKEPYEREHVMPWFYDTEGRCKVRILDHDPDCGTHRWTVDTPDDYAMMQALFARIDDPLTIPWLEVLKIVEADPTLEKINEHAHAKQVDVVDERSQDFL